MSNQDTSVGLYRQRLEGSGPGFRRCFLVEVTSRVVVTGILGALSASYAYPQDALTCSRRCLADGSASGAGQQAVDFCVSGCYRLAAPVTRPAGPQAGPHLSLAGPVPPPRTTPATPPVAAVVSGAMSAMASSLSNAANAEALHGSQMMAARAASGARDQEEARQQFQQMLDRTTTAPAAEHSQPDVGVAAPVELVDPFRTSGVPKSATSLTTAAPAAKMIVGRPEACTRRGRVAAVIQELELELGEAERLTTSATGEAEKGFIWTGTARVVKGLADGLMDTLGQETPFSTVYSLATSAVDAAAVSTTDRGRFVAASEIVGGLSGSHVAEGAASLLSAGDEGAESDGRGAVASLTKASASLARDLGASTQNAGMKAGGSLLQGTGGLLDAGTQVARGVDEIQQAAVEIAAISARGASLHEMILDRIAHLRALDDRLAMDCINASMPTARETP